MGLLSAFQNNPAFQQQLSALTQMQGPGTQPIQRQPMANMPQVMNPGGGIGGGALDPSQVRNPAGNLDRWQYGGLQQDGGLSAFGGDYAAQQRWASLPLVLPHANW